MRVGSPLESVKYLETGKIIAYPTESIYGIGCDPYNYDAVQKIFKIKNRPNTKPMILIASHLTQIVKLVDNQSLTKTVMQTWPGHTTWLLPASAECPEWLYEKESKKIAIRVSAHRDVISICKNFNKPIISTSANKSMNEPIKEISKIKNIFEGEIDFIVEGNIGQELKPSVIKDFETGKIVRS
tara:strand:- start:978 stop:1529 length:552 start_codon:yes stop_codon:yes gene_type:complete